MYYIYMHNIHWLMTIHDKDEIGHHIDSNNDTIVNEQLLSLFVRKVM